MIGLSLSFCIHDIIAGLVKLEDVDYIITGTAWGTEQEVQDGVEYYCLEYWQENVDEARKVFWMLWGDGRIVQPRVVGDYHDVEGIGQINKRWIP